MDSSLNKCTYTVTTNKCIAATACTDIKLGNSIVNTEKQDVCLNG